MLTKSTNYGPCENLHTEEDIPPATHLVEKDWQGITSSLLVCRDCADRFDAQGWYVEALRSSEEEEMPYREEWEAIYGNLPRDINTHPVIDPGSFNPF